MGLNDGHIFFSNFGFSRSLDKKGNFKPASAGGTETYMAAEQGDEERYDRRVDVYALGGVFFDILAKLHGIFVDTLHGTFAEHGERSCHTNNFCC